ncbi:hypothetical protein D3C76_749440 [compost metagenome]
MIAATALIDGCPAHHIAAVCQRRHTRIQLIVGRGAVDPHLVTHCVTAHIVALRVDAPAAAVLAVGHPAHHITTVAEPGDHRCLLAVDSGAVDSHLVTHRSTAGIVALRVDAIAAAILAVGHPAHHIAAICQRRHTRIYLITGRGTVDPPLADQCLQAHAIAKLQHFEIVQGIDAFVTVNKIQIVDTNLVTPLYTDGKVVLIALIQSRILTFSPQ